MTHKRMTRHTVTIIVVIVFITAVVVAVFGRGLFATSSDALGKVRCEASVGSAQVDPIVHHNEAPGTAHQHSFYGNSSWLTTLPNPNAANYGDLINRATNCRLAADTAGYWIPTLRYVSGPLNGQAVLTNQFTAYYRPYTGSGSKFGPGQAFPPDTRLVGTRYNWSCGQNSGARSAPVSSIPDCSGLSGRPGETLTGHIDFPSCWNGVMPAHKSTDVGDTQDTANYRYPVNKACPSTHPKQMVQLRETLQFAYTGRGNDVNLASDAERGTTDGRSLHADFWQAWSPQSAFVQFVKDCVNVGGAYSTAKCAP